MELRNWGNVGRGNLGGPMPRIEFPGFCGPHYDYGVFGAAALSAAKCQNLYPETAAQQARTQHFLIGRPGMATFTSLATSPIRAMFSSNTNALYTVGGSHFYSVLSGPTITDLGAMGGSTGLGPCYIAAMGVGTGANNGPMVCDTSTNQLYVNTGVATMTSEFNGRAIEYLDGFMIAIASGASLQNANQPNQINVSAFGDCTNWTPGPGATQAFAIRSGGSDFIYQLAVLNGFLWIFGEKTTEIWFNAGLSPFPFQRYQGATLNLGTLSPASVVKFFNTIVWVGSDHSGYTQVYMTKGMSPVKISDPAVEAYMGNLANANGIGLIAGAWAHGYQEAGHTFYEVVFQTGGNSAQTTSLVYDLTEGIWHTRTYGGVIPITSQSVPAVSTPTGHPNLIGSYASGQILIQALNQPADLTTGGSATSITRVRQAPYVTELGTVARHKRFEVIGNLGTAAPTLSVSDDMGQTYRQNYNLTGPGTDQGWSTSGTYQRWYAQQLGRSRARVYQMNITDQTNLIRIAGAYLDIDPGIGQ